MLEFVTFQASSGHVGLNITTSCIETCGIICYLTSREPFRCSAGWIRHSLRMEVNFLATKMPKQHDHTGEIPSMSANNFFALMVVSC